MLHDHIDVRTRLGLVLTTLLVASLTPVASAQTATPKPVIDRASRSVAFEGTATIRGHLKNGTPGDEVTLQRRRGDNPWWNVSSKPVDDALEVTFKRHDLKRATRYRLVYSDELQSLETRSEAVTVTVAPKLTLRVNPDDIFVGGKVKLTGRLLPKKSGREVVFKRKVQGRWKTIKKTDVKDGRFSARFTARYKGHRKVRVVFSGDAVSREAKRTKPFTTYRPDEATWYGPGLFGNGTACGQTLRRGTLGVAHRTLPCGSKVSIMYQGRSITVRVIDRGPYSHANWDLTQETAQRIGFSGSGTVGVTR